MWQRVGRAVCSCYMVWRKKVIDSIYYNDLERMSIFLNNCRGEFIRQIEENRANKFAPTV